MQATDVRGEDICVGDTVLYFDASKYSDIIEAVVVDIKTKVKVRVVRCLQRGKHGFHRAESEKWVYSDSLVRL